MCRSRHFLKGFHVAREFVVRNIRRVPGILANHAKYFLQRTTEVHFQKPRLCVDAITAQEILHEARHKCRWCVGLPYHVADDFTGIGEEFLHGIDFEKQEEDLCIHREPEDVELGILLAHVWINNASGI